MRNPVRTEGEAFSFVLVIVAVGLAVGLAAWLGGTAAGVGVLVGLGAGVLAGIFLGREPAVREAPIWRRGSEGSPRRILVIANETCAGQRLLEELRYRARGYEAELLVVAPAPVAHARVRAPDIDAARTEAEERLETSLTALASAGLRARGEVGDGEPLQAIEDALRTFDAEEIVISTHVPGRSSWLEHDVVARARGRFELPITHVVVDIEREKASAGSR